MALSASSLPFAFLNGRKPCIAFSAIRTFAFVPADERACPYRMESSRNGSISAPMTRASGSLDKSGARDGDIIGERLSLSSLE